MLLLVLSRCNLFFLRTRLFFIFFDNFYNAFFQRGLVHNDGLDSVCQNAFLRYGQMNSVFRSLLRFSMIFYKNLPRFICNYFCFAGIVVETYQESWRTCLSSFCTSVYTLPLLPSRTPSLRSFPLATSPALCTRVMISCSIHGVDELYSCEESPTWLHSLGGITISPECHWIARISLNFPSSSLQISNLFWSFCGKGNATNPHMWIFFPINLGILHTSHSRYWKCGILVFSHFFSFHFHHGVEVDLLEDERFN